MRKFLIIILSTCILFLLSSIARAADLLTVYQQAVVSDPEFAAANATRMANEEDVPINRAALLPNISASGNDYANRTSINISGAGRLAQDLSGNSNTSEVPIEGTIDYNSHSYTLNATQAIFNFADWMLLRQAQAIATQANYTYGAELQALILRVANAYFNVLFAEDTLTDTVAQKQANLESLQQIKARYDAGLETMTDVDQAQASYDGLVAQEITDNNNVTNNLQALRQITDITYSELAPLKNNMPLINPDPINIDSWVHAAEQKNLTLLATRYNVQAFHELVRVNFANNFPVLNAVGSYEHEALPALLNFGVSGNENLNQSMVGVQVTVPIVSGGLTVAQTAQAEDNYVNASDQMEETHRQVIFNTTQSFNNVMANISKIKADRLTIISNKSALSSIDAGFQAGTKTLLDVLTAQQNLYQAETTAAQDQYTYILNTLTLKQAAGTLNPGDLIEINSWLKGDHLFKINSSV